METTTTYYCAPQEFCIYQAESGGGKALRFYCTYAAECPHPDKRCLYKKNTQQFEFI